jgi:hypothetical protein
MSPRIFLPVSLLIVSFAAFTSVANANPKTNANKVAQAAEVKQKAAEEARKKADEARTQSAQGFYNDIHGANPSVTVDQIKSMSSEDIRDLYSRTYCAQGMSLSEAKAKAQALKIWNN